MYDREEHLLGLSQAAFSHDTELLVTRLRALATATGRSDSGMTFDDRVEVIERMAMFMDTRASQLAAAGRVSGVLRGELQSWAIAPAEHRRLCGVAVQMLAVLISANALCAASLDEARAVGMEAAAALAAIVKAADSGSKLPPLMAVGMGNVLLLLASDSRRQSAWERIMRLERPPRCVWIDAAFAATLGASDSNNCAKEVSDLNDRSREVEVLLGSTHIQWLWPLIASCPYPAGMITAVYVALEGTADLSQITVALMAVFGLLAMAGVCFERKTEVSAWQNARELQLQWLGLLNQSCVHLPAAEDEPESEPEPKPELVTATESKEEKAVSLPHSDPADDADGLITEAANIVEVNMGEELAKLQRAFEMNGTGESGHIGETGLGSSESVGMDAGTGETGGVAVPLPDDLELNLKKLLGALEEEGSAETKELRDRLTTQLQWLRSQKDKAAGAADLTSS